MGRKVKAENRSSAATLDAVARERALRYLRLAGFGRGGRRVRIHASEAHGTHWLFTFAVSSLEDPSRDFMYANVVAEKATGYVYAFPSRAPQPIDGADIASIRQGCSRITPHELEQWEEK